MIERIALIALIGAALAGIFYAMRYWHVWRMRPAHKGITSPTLLYFRGDHCAVCPAQERIINQLVAQRDGELHVERIDAERDPETAARYSVFTLPTTIWMDTDGQVRQVNYGLADTSKLDRQFQSLTKRQIDGQSTPRAVASESI